MRALQSFRSKFWTLSGIVALSISLTGPVLHASELDDRAAALSARAVELDAAKKRQVTKYENAIADYSLAINLDPLYPQLEAAFRRDLVEKYKSEHFDEAQFNAFFTPDYLNSYNAQLKRRQAAMAQYNKILLDADTALRDSAGKLKQEVDDTNAELVKDGKAKIALPANEGAVDGKLDNLRAVVTQLPERLISMEDVRAKIGVKADAKVARAPELRPQPVPPEAPRMVRPLPPIQPEVQRPLPPSTQDFQRPPPPQLPPAPPAISALDTLGVWVRADGKMTWNFEPNGIVIVHGKDKKATRGTWAFDERTTSVTLTHDGAIQTLSMLRDRGLLYMEGGSGPGSTVRFAKSIRAQ